MILRAFDGDWKPFYATIEKITDQMMDVTVGASRKKLYNAVIDITDGLYDSGDLETETRMFVFQARTNRTAPATQLADDLDRTLHLLDGRISAALHNALVNELTVVKLGIEEGVQV
jgi:hypothetical protein